MKFVALALVTVALAGCFKPMPEEAKSPEVHMCKAYTDEPTCAADPNCKWKTNVDGVAKCKAL